MYQITRVISDFSADALTGCGTRVFETCLKLQDGKLVKTAEPVVWKDSWRDCDQDREDIIFKQIYADLRKHKGSGKEEEVGKYFLTMFAVGNVMMDGKIDVTDSLLRGSKLLANSTSYPSPADELPQPKPTRTGEGLTDFPLRLPSHKAFESSS